MNEFGVINMKFNVNDVVAYLVSYVRRFNKMSMISYLKTKTAFVWHKQVTIYRKYIQRNWKNVRENIGIPFCSFLVSSALMAFTAASSATFRTENYKRWVSSQIGQRKPSNNDENHATRGCHVDSESTKLNTKFLRCYKSPLVEKIYWQRKVCSSVEAEFNSQHVPFIERCFICNVFGPIR